MFKRVISFILVITLSWAGLTLPARAAIIDTQQAISLDTRQQRIDWVQAQLAGSEIQQGMIDLGVDPEKAAERIASLSDQELLQLQTQLENAPAGGGILGLIGAVFVVLLILELTGVIDIFKK